MLAGVTISLLVCVVASAPLISALLLTRTRKISTTNTKLYARSRDNNYFNDLEKGSYLAPATQGNSVNNSRKKMGRPQRKIVSENEYTSSAPGRVSVYCVGDELDLQALRTHIFRRGFGNQKSPEAIANGETPALVLARGEATTESSDIIDDEVLHVSNAPLFVSYNSNNKENKYDENGVESNDDIRERLLMATQDIFYFDYGCVVFWGLSAAEEKAAIDELALFTIEKNDENELESSYDTMEFVLDKKANPQRPIKFDRMRLRTLQVEEKLSLSYAMAQSSKLFVFEQKVFKSVEMTRYLPKELATKGKINSSKKELNQLIGQLFVQQTEVNLFSSILDTPDFLWDDDEHLPVYEFTRSYLEVDDRVALLNSRLAVIRELLGVIEAQLADSNSTRLEWIIIWLISVEIVMGIASNPMFAGKRVLSALLVPAAIALFSLSKK